jgi:hypothetical protein
VTVADALRWIVEGVVTLVVVDQLLLAAERRGWIRWRRTKADRRAVGRAALQVQSLFEPAVEHVVEERSRVGAQDDEDGDPPDPVV